MQIDIVKFEQVECHFLYSDCACAGRLVRAALRPTSDGRWPLRWLRYVCIVPATAPRRKHCDALRSRHHFGQFVRDKKHGIAIVGQLAEDLKEPLDFLRGEHAGWLIKDQNLWPQPAKF